jgi:exopolysaccharide biosynthesis WecB/TagA/CpsF family protein
VICPSFTARPLPEHDVTIVGSGPAGLVLALELARRGRRVVVLESGGRAADPRQQALSDAEIVDPARHDDMSIAVSRRLGGTSNLWAVRCQPYDPIDFEARPGLVEARWPIGQDEIRPYYPRAVEYLQAGENVFDEPIPGLAITDHAFDHTRLERFAVTPQVQKRHAAELRRSELIDVRLNSTVVELDLVEGSIRGLVVADPDGTRHRMATTIVVLACGGLESTRQLLVLQKQHPELFGGPEGPLGRYYMGHLIGEVADVVFASDVVDEAYDFRLDGHGSYARRRFVPSDDEQRRHRLLNICFWPVVPPIADPRHRSGLLSMVCLAFAIAPLGRLVIAEAIRKRHIPDDFAWGPHVVNVVRDLPRAAIAMILFLYRRYLAKIPMPGFFVRNAARRYGLSYHCEQSPQPDSRVRLAATTDRLGMPRLAIDYRFARADAEAVLRAHLRLSDWMERTGIGRVELRQPEEETVDAILAIAAHGTHQIGTARMAATPSEGVVDRDLRCFGIDNLYVASSAVFPTSGQCNPTLGIAAFSLRLAEHLSTPAAAGPRVATAPATAGRDRWGGTMATTTRDFFDFAFTTGSIEEITDLLVAAARDERTTVVVTPNVHHVVALETQLPTEVRTAYASADRFLCDSRILARLAKWSGLELTPRTGTDRVADLLAAAGDRDLVFAVAGPRREQTEALAARFPERRFLHLDTPTRLVRGTPEWDACVAEAAAASWQVLLCCLSFPKQELFAADLRAARRAGGVVMCVGAAVDFLSGSIRRAPIGFQRLGFEWLYRLLSDPRRLWRRYLVDGPRIFLLYLARRRDGRL